MGHFRGKLLAIDPHRVKVTAAVECANDHNVEVVGQTVSVILVNRCRDTATYCFTTSTAATSVVEATPTLLHIGERILAPLQRITRVG